MNENIDKMNIIKIEKREKNFCFVKDTVMRIQREAKDWETIVAKHISQKSIKIYKEILKLNNKKTGNSV